MKTQEAIDSRFTECESHATEHLQGAFLDFVRPSSSHGGIGLEGDSFQVFDLNDDPVGSLTLKIGHTPDISYLTYHRNLWRKP